ncbi:MAG: hypothetical protein Q9224_002544 [Gallowayella concinna]
MTFPTILGPSAATAHWTELRVQTMHSSVTHTSLTQLTTKCVGRAFRLSIRRKIFGTVGEENTANLHVVPFSTAHLDLLVEEHRKMRSFHSISISAADSRKRTIADGEDVATAVEQHVATRWKSRTVMAFMIPQKLRIGQEPVAGVGPMMGAFLDFWIGTL